MKERSHVSLEFKELVKTQRYTMMVNAHSELISTHISGAEVFGSCLSDYLLGKLGCDLHDAR